MRRPAPRLAAVCLFLSLATFAHTSDALEIIQKGVYSLQISAHGVLVRVPDTGLRTIDGPFLELRPGFAEWYGVSYRTEQGSAQHVGLGAERDWAGRRPVEAVSSRSFGRGAETITRGGELDIVTRFEFDRRGDAVLASVEFTNRGSTIVRDLVYTREWRQEGAEAWTFPEDIGGLPEAPPSISRAAWMLDDLAPGRSGELRFAYEPCDAPGDDDPEVPLELWRNAAFPNGIPIGLTSGVSWGDYDADGWVDLFSFRSGRLWRNVDGTTWELAYDLDSMLPESDRYGSSFGDFNADGLPDIGTEPRHEFSFHLLKNLGGGPNFVDVAPDPSIVDVRPYGDSETLCWGDVNGDGHLDAFLPVYPAWANDGPGNFFLFNLGPTGPGGAYRFVEMAVAAGLDNPPGSARPEGAQFVDVDFDGDLDCYSNGTLYQNRSSLTTPQFGAMTESASGIGLSSALDEGAAFFDYDLDGDYDLAVVYSGPGVQIWENAGDGTFFAPDPEMIEDRFVGLNLGLSAEDWDNDGDVDFTTRHVFRKNLLIEEGVRRFAVSPNALPHGHLTSATPAWADWDKDGDLDCALGNWHKHGHFYENTTYDATTPDDERRHVRVRVVRDSPTVPAGLETEYGASVEVILKGEAADGHRRRKFVASSHGYLNQNEYTLHFALPPDPFPEDPAQDVVFDLVVDFPGLPEDGLWRVDRFVNPVLGNLHLAELNEREIRVYREGRVVVDGVTTEPPEDVSPRLATTGGGLALPSPSSGLSGLVTSPNWMVGLAFNTSSAEKSFRMKEIILDGQLDAPTLECGTSFNLALWDVTEAGASFLVENGALVEETSERNRRHYIPTDIVLQPQREYRLVAKVKSFRPSPFQAPAQGGPVEVEGGLSFSASDPCGSHLEILQALPIRSYLAFRYSSDPGAATAGPLPGGEDGSEPRFELLAARPNPFHASTTLPFFLGRASETRITIYDVTGRRVRDLAPGFLEPGAHRVHWDARSERGESVASGVYFYELRVNGEVGGRRKIVLRR